MDDELKDMLLRYLRDMSERGDHTARQLLPLVLDHEDSLLEVEEIE
jgi:hypothetical protein